MMIMVPEAWASPAEYLDQRTITADCLIGLFLCALTLAVVWSTVTIVVEEGQRRRHHRCVICLDSLSTTRPCCPRCTVSTCLGCQVDYHTFRRSRACPVCGGKLYVPTVEADGIDPEQAYRLWFGLLLGRLERIVVEINSGMLGSERCRRLAEKLLRILDRNRRALFPPGSALREVVKLQFAGLAREYPEGGPEVQRRALMSL